MYFATTNSHAVGPQTAMTIDHLGDVTVGKITATSFLGKATSAGNADTANGQKFNWTNTSNSPTYLWAADANGTAFLASRASISVNYANSAGTSATATNISNTGTVNLASATESNAITITAPSYSTDKPVKLLNFNWYTDAWSIGNIRSGDTNSNGLGIYLNSVEKFRFYNGVLKIGTNTV